jgi:hypothetical protein
VQLNIGHLDESGVYTNSFSTFALCGQVRAKVRDASHPNGDITSGLPAVFLVFMSGMRCFFNIIPRQTYCSYANGASMNCREMLTPQWTFSGPRLAPRLANKLLRN